MSTVVLAEDRVLGRLVAIKLLAEHLADDSQFISRFRRQTMAVARLVHPNIVQVHDFGLDQESGRFFVVMEYISGSSAAEMLREKAPLGVPLAISLVDDVAAGLVHAHRLGIVHCAVRPEHILVPTDGLVKLSGFGSATITSRSASVRKHARSLPYLAPEQLSDEPVSHFTDLYSLGVVAYQLLSGRLPHEADSIAKLAQLQRKRPVRLNEILPEVSAAIAVAIERALAFEPDRRFATATEMRLALQEGAKISLPPAPAITMPHVFLCHSSADKPAVRRLYDKLHGDGLAPWLDEQDLLPGQNWELAIRDAVRASRFVLVCLSDASTTRAGYVHREIKQALDVADEQPEGTIFIIPLRLEDCEVPRRLGHLHWLDLFKEDGYARLVRVLRSNSTR
jgi:serine/threonine protein kinase